MRQPPKTYLAVRAKLDENEVPYLVPDPRMPSRRVGIRHRDLKPENLDHFADQFEPHVQVIEVVSLHHLAHYRSEQAAGTLEILGQCQAKDEHEARTKLLPTTSSAAAAAVTE